MDGYYRHDNANVHRGIYALSERATAAYEGAREKVARLIGVADPRTIVWTRNATESINLVAYAWGRRNIGRGDVIVLTEMEHHANLVPWQVLAQEKDADLEFIPITDDGILRQDVFEVLLRLKPKMVAFTHVSNTLGTINPVAEMTRKAHEAGALVLIDGAQAVPHLPVDVAAIGCDFYVFSGHKALGPTGSGVALGPPRAAGGDAAVHGWRRHDPRGPPPALRVERHPVEVRGRDPGHLGADRSGCGSGLPARAGHGPVRDHEADLVAYALDVLAREVPGIEIYGPAAELRGGVVSFNLPGIHPHDVAQVLEAPAWRSAPVITARCRSTSAWTSLPPPAPRSSATRRTRTSTPWRSACRRSSASSGGDRAPDIQSSLNTLARELGPHLPDVKAVERPALADRDGRGHPGALAADRAAHHRAHRGMADLVAPDRPPGDQEVPHAFRARASGTARGNSGRSSAGSARRSRR